MQTEILPDKPFDLISSDGVSCLFDYGYPQSRYFEPVLFDNDRKMSGAVSFS